MYSYGCVNDAVFIEITTICFLFFKWSSFLQLLQKETVVITAAGFLQVGYPVCRQSNSGTALMPIIVSSASKVIPH